MLDKSLLKGLFEHSDFTIRARTHDKFRRQVDMYLSNNYDLLNDEVISRLFIRNTKDVILALKAYPTGMPIQMHYYIIGFLEGQNKAKRGGTPLSADWAKNHDVIGIFIELTKRFHYRKTEVYEFIAEILIPDNGSDKDGAGVEAVRQYVERYIKKTRSTYD